ncbi:casein kinase I-like [Ochotona curzoniae]|uniref:casein kinase I-like n=1 Tax=Ochotona curzoniae TaxID=130825 RepID=UPI001B34C100|nr:casein kinase I-like [Ochotona curzoniae]
MASTSDALNEFIVGGKYKLVRKIGSGTFGSIYLSVDVRTGEQVAVKLESQTIRYPRLLYESRCYTILQGGVGIPRLRWYGQDKGYNALAMDLLGPNLEVLFRYCSRTFTMKTVLMLADQMIKIIEYVHTNDIIHRDIKPHNFLIGRGRHCNKVFLVDFGIAKKYTYGPSGKHIPFNQHKNPSGTPLYASLNAHLGFEQSRRDDLEAIGYVLMYFARGGLPWQGLPGNTKKQRREKITETKLSTPVEVLCEGFPTEFTTYLNYCRALQFEETPDYMYLRRLFHNLFRSLNDPPDYTFDWATVNTNSAQPATAVTRQVQEDHLPAHSQG